MNAKERIKKTMELREAHIEQMKRFESDPEVREAARDFDLIYTVAGELCAARLKAKVSQTELAERIHTSQSSLARIERGQDIKISTLARFAAACGKRVEIRLV